MQTAEFTVELTKQVRETVRAEMLRQKNLLQREEEVLNTPFNWSWARTTEAVAAGTEASPTSTTIQLRKKFSGSWADYGDPVDAEHPWDQDIADNTLVIAVPQGNVWVIWVANCLTG